MTGKKQEIMRVLEEILYGDVPFGDIYSVITAGQGVYTEFPVEEDDYTSICLMRALEALIYAVKADRKNKDPSQFLTICEDWLKKMKLPAPTIKEIEDIVWESPHYEV